jgi:hypothetical protein
MMMQSTFVDWDFDNVWCIVEGKTYPQLQHFVDCDTLVSVEDIRNDEGVDIYPNPAEDEINISSSDLISGIKIINMLGNVVKEGRPEGLSEKMRLSVEDLNEGIYLLIIESKSNFYSRKIIVF